MRYKLIAPRDETLNPIQQIFKNRQMPYSKDEISHYLYPTKEDMYPLKYITNLREGARMLWRHIVNNDDALVIVDDDADGFTSSALFLNYLYKLVPHYVLNHITYQFHSGKKHGIISTDDVAPWFSLVIVIDSSSNEYELHKDLHDNGIDVLCIDHHQASNGYSQYACVINNQLDDYPNKSLSGVAMVYKFCKYLDALGGVEYADEFLDLVAVGVTGDVMDMRNYETRYLVYSGMKNLNNPLIVALYQKTEYSIDKKGGLSPFNIAYYIAPLINATTRVGTIQEKQILFESMLEFRAFDKVPSTKRGEKGKEELLVTQAARNCSNIKNRQTKERDKAYQEILHIIDEQHLLDHKILLIKMKSGDPAIAGLIANLLVSKFHHPTLILFEREPGIWSGSARNDDRYGLADFRQFILDSDCAEWAQGHANAFGACFSTDNIVNFLQYGDSELSDCDFSATELVDFIFPTPSHINTDFVLDVGKLNFIWGERVEEPLIAIEKIQLTQDNSSFVGKKQDTLKIELPSGISMICFGITPENAEALTSPSTGCVTINILGTCNINSYNGTDRPQIIISEYEITGRQEYYF